MLTSRTDTSCTSFGHVPSVSRSPSMCLFGRALLAHGSYVERHQAHIKTSLFQNTTPISSSLTLSLDQPSLAWNHNFSSRNLTQLWKILTTNLELFWGNFLLQKCLKTYNFLTLKFQLLTLTVELYCPLEVHLAKNYLNSNLPHFLQLKLKPTLLKLN